MKASATTLPRRSASAVRMPSCEVNAKGGAGPITGSRLSPTASCAGSNVGNSDTANARTSAMPPLTLPLRGSLPLPARGEREGVRGTFNLVKTSLSHLQLAFELVEEAPIGVVGDDLVRS